MALNYNVKECDDSTLISYYASTNSLDEADTIAEELRSRGYHFKGFTWSKDPDEEDPVEKLRKEIYGE